MKYSKQVNTFGTSIFNKLLGTYEREITPFIETIIKKTINLFMILDALRDIMLWV